MRTWKVRETLGFIWSVDFLRMTVLWTWSLIFSHFQILILQWRFSRNSTGIYRRCSLPSTSFRPLCVITGATSGLGAAAAYALSKEGFYVVLVGRSSQLLSKTLREIKTRNEHAEVKAFRADMSSFSSIVEFKESLEQWLSSSGMHSSVQLLINNAGILATSRRFTPEGYDETMATNYIGAFGLTKILLPLLENSPTPSRIVNVTSFTHRNATSVKVNEEDVTGKSFSKSRQYPYARVYEYTKLCVLFFSYELHRRLGLKTESRKVSVVAADPGVVETNIMREIPACITRLTFLILKLLGLLQSPDSGVRSIIDAALAPPEISGVYFFGGNGRTIKSLELSYDGRLARELWTVSSDLICSHTHTHKGHETSQ